MLRHLITAYGYQRLVIGTDYPLPAGIAHPVAEVKALQLDAEAEAAILGGNANRLLRLSE
jgi:predicted TIM-barrel fold metal-dependent hydrolase